LASFLDTNVAVYAFDRAAGRKRERALEILSDTSLRLVVSPQVLNEFYVTVTRKLARPLAPDVAGDAVRELARLDVVPLDAGTTLEAIALSQASRISLWDASIVVAASHGGCTTLLSEDLNHGQRLLDVDVANPFR
jgi:predicted nucleic acid-binding protein